jgi:hypothetical protein
MSNEYLIFLLANSNTGLHTVEGSSFKARRIEGIKYTDETPQKKMERSISEGNIRHNNRKVYQYRN